VGINWNSSERQDLYFNRGDFVGDIPSLYIFLCNIWKEGKVSQYLKS
jgi:hypothetical protein